MRKFQAITLLALFSISLLSLASCSNTKKSVPGGDDDVQHTTDVQNDSDSSLVIDDTQDGDNNLSDSDTGDSESDIDSADTAGDSDISDTANPDESPDEDEATPNGMGPGSTNPYDPTDGNADSVVVGDDGKLKLDGDSETAKLRYLWVSNAVDGTISKIDTFDKIEVARYHSGLSTGSNPSRTTVDLIGDMFVGNRNDSSVTKIAGNLDRCIDKNSNGTIETSSGPDDILPRDATTGKSTDECILWTRVFNDTDLKPEHTCGGIRAMAATPETGLEFSYNGHVWVGCMTGDPYSYKLNGNTGDIIDVRSMVDEESHRCGPYGFVLDKTQKLWIACRTWGAGLRTPGIAWLDVSEGATDKKLHYVTTPGLFGGNGPYGIAIDNKKRIWATEAYESDDSTRGFLFRYTPDANPLLTGTWDALKISEKHHRGLASDKYGYIWVTTTEESAPTIPIPQEVSLVNSDTFPDPASLLDTKSFSDGTNTPHQGTGIAVDFNGNVWGVSRCQGGQGFASFFEIDRSGATPTIVTTSIKNIPIGNGPYSYSDMVGYNLKNFASIEGWYRQTFEVCEGALPSTIWKKIYWEADIPANTKILIRARTAEDKITLASATWQTIVIVPTDASPNEIPSLPKGHFIQLEVRMYSSEWNLTPTVGLIYFDYECSLPS